MRISDWSSDVCSSDLHELRADDAGDLIIGKVPGLDREQYAKRQRQHLRAGSAGNGRGRHEGFAVLRIIIEDRRGERDLAMRAAGNLAHFEGAEARIVRRLRSEEHTSELQSQMRNSNAD